ncbi:LicD family protein [Nostocoides japonicum T1-X7]|uniref:LicD family protein n=1 Tax=Nostocoides japonicum T1-X7 TaxID=1194083 RepID=A0A077LZB3_9MICO|nr:hypothetical protein [Tetrasphaera japonica]CCH79248.1 LicD family protein [Tetrasphaera japonica T1-X7]
MTDSARLEPLRRVAEAAADRFPEVGHLGPGGVLHVDVPHSAVTAVRLEVPGNEFLHVQTIGLLGEGGVDLSAGARVAVSSWYGQYEAAFSTDRLFDTEHPTGTVVHTERGNPAWLEITFPRPVPLRRIVIRNVPIRTARRLRDLRVLVTRRWRRPTVVFDGGRASADLERLTEPLRSDPDEAVRALVPVLTAVVRGDYKQARTDLDGVTDLGADTRREFVDILNTTLLPRRQLWWTTHGPTRAFRFWSPEEQVRYVRSAAEIAEALTGLTPNVSLGFGSVLAAVRDHALIPHDDDLDIIIGFEPEEARTLQDGLALVSEFLQARGFVVKGNFSAHRHVSRPRRKHVDVFVGLFEGDVVSWYPGPRGGLTRDVVFPTTTIALLGVDCPVPARPEAYLEGVYGPGWRVPDPGFAHSWDRAAYADISGSPGPA